MISYAARRSRLLPRRYSPPLVRATVLRVDDRAGLVDVAGQPRLVIVPNGLWLQRGMLVGLYHYPDGWVVVGIYTDRQTDLPVRP